MKSAEISEENVIENQKEKKMTEYFAFESADEDDHPLKSDPYEVQKRTTESELFHLQNDFETWQTLLETTNTAKSNKFNTVTQSVKRQMKTVQKSLKELDELNTKRNDRISNLSEEDIEQRKKYITDTQALLQNMKDKIRSPRTKLKVEKNRQELLNERNSAFRSAISSDADERNGERRLRDYEQSQQMVHKEQDDILEDMLSSIQKLGMMGDVISHELHEQNELIDEIDDDMDAAQDRLTRMTLRLDRILGHSDSKKWCLIIALSIVLMIMIYFMF